MNEDASSGASALNFRIPKSFRLAIDTLASASGWTRTDIAVIGLMVFWRDIEAMVLATQPNRDLTAETLKEMRELAQTFRAARAAKLPIREIILQAMEAQIAEGAEPPVGN